METEDAQGSAGIASYSYTQRDGPMQKAHGHIHEQLQQGSGVFVEQPGACFTTCPRRPQRRLPGDLELMRQKTPDPFSWSDFWRVRRSVAHESATGSNLGLIAKVFASV